MFALIVFCLLLMLFSVKATPILFNLSDFNAVPATNRTLQLQFQSPFVGNNIFITSDTNGQIITNLPLATLINATIKAPPANITFQLWIPADTTGTNNATNFTAVSGISTYPAGATAPSIQMADARYARGTNTGGAGVGVAGGQNTTVTTNGSVVSVNATNQIFLTNGILGGSAVTNAILGLGNVLTNGLVGSGVTNGLFSGNAVTNAVAGLLNAGTNNLATQPFVTNAVLGLGSVLTNGYVRSNAVLALIFDGTNGYVRSSITNGLFSGNQVSNSVLNLINDATNGFVRSSITNGLASMNAVTNIANSYSNGVLTVVTNIVNNTGCGAATNILLIPVGNTIFGGSGNSYFTNAGSTAFYNTIIGGQNNTVTSPVSGSSTGNGIIASLSGGISSSAQYSAIIGGSGNGVTTSSNSAAIAGSGNVVSANNSIALAGSSLKINPNGVNSIVGVKNVVASFSNSVVFGDGVSPASNSVANQFIANFSGGIGFNTNAPAAGSLSLSGNLIVNGTNILNGISFTNLPSVGGSANIIITTNQLSYTVTQNGLITATNGTANSNNQGFFSIGGGYTFLTSTNVFGSTNAGTASGNGTWVFNGVDLTNRNDITHIVFSSPNYLLMSGATTLYSSTSIVGVWSIVSGASPAPTFFLGFYADDSGIVWTGSGGGFTNLVNVSWNTNTSKTLPVRSASMYWVFTNGQPIYGIISTN